MAASVEEGELEILRAEGKRITPQRKLLLEIIRESRGHLDAGEIYYQARSRDPRISLSTVYRNLNLLKELGLIAEVHLDEEHHHYEATDDTQHFHLICSGCGRVVEFDNPSVGTLLAQVGEDEDFLIERVDIDLVGLCPECRSRSGG
jgi:Fur family ferric uptake transcriptional regulator